MQLKVILMTITDMKDAILAFKGGSGAVDCKEETLLMSDSGKERTSSRSVVDVNGKI